MCLLMVTMGQLPPREALVNASINNPDGFGFAVNHGDHIVTGRSMRYENLIERFYAEMENSKNPIGMFHARYTTHGRTMLENNHPFRVDGRKDLILAHNGMLPIYPREGDVRSDTRIFAEDILGGVGVENLDDKYGFSMLEDFARGSKVAVLSTAPELRDSVYILNEELGHWDGDIWWSNYGYEASRYLTGYYPTYKKNPTVIGGTKDWWEDDTHMDDVMPPEACGNCFNHLTRDDEITGMCHFCDSCIDCLENIYTCQCYTASASAQVATLDTMAWNY